jgi:hypothetical protein
MPITIASTLNSITSYTHNDTDNKLDSCTFSSLILGASIIITLNGAFIHNDSSYHIVAKVFASKINTTAEITSTASICSFSSFSTSDTNPQNSLTSTDTNIKINQVGTYYLYTFYDPPSGASNIISKSYVEFTIANNTIKPEIPNMQSGVSSHVIDDSAATQAARTAAVQSYDNSLSAIENTSFVILTAAEIADANAADNLNNILLQLTQNISNLSSLLKKLS